MPLPPDRDLAEWDAEIEAEYSRFKESWNASGRRKRAVRHVGVPWAYLSDVCRLTEGRAALVLAIYIYRRTIVCHGLTVTLPSEELAELKVTRRLKSKALARLQQVGLIRVENLDRADGSGDFDLVAEWPCDQRKSERLSRRCAERS